MAQILWMISLCFSVFAAVFAVAVLVRAVRILQLVRKQDPRNRKGMTLEGGDDG